MPHTVLRFANIQKPAINILHFKHFHDKTIWLILSSSVFLIFISSSGSNALKEQHLSNRLQKYLPLKMD